MSKRYTEAMKAARDATRTRGDHIRADPLVLRTQLRQPVKCIPCCQSEMWCLVHQTDDGGVHDRMDCARLHG